MTIGPLTNIGVLFGLDPEIPGLLKRVYSMCGYYQGKLEWNAMGDPYATAIVYQNPASIHRSFGLDVTQKVYLDAEVVRERFQGRALEPVLDFAEVWFTKNRGLTFHDPLPAIALLIQRFVVFREAMWKLSWSAIGKRHDSLGSRSPRTA